MFDLGTTSQIVTLGAGSLGILGGLVVWLRWARPAFRWVIRFFRRLDQTINGRPAEHDAWGREVSPAVPALAEQMTSIKEQVESLAKSDSRLSALEQIVAANRDELAGHDRRLTAIESGAQIERSLGHVANAKTMDAIEAVARKGQPDAD